MSVAVYTDSNHFDCLWLPKLFFPGECILYHSRHEYSAAQADKKIAFTTEQFALDYDIGDPPRPGPLPKADFPDKINELSYASDLVFTFGGELHSTQWAVWDKCHHDNVYWVIPGTVTESSALKNNIIVWHDWLKIIANLYQNQLSNKLAEISYNLPKPKYFDALLGRKRVNRDAVYQGVVANNLQDKFIMTYMGDTDVTIQGDFIWEKDCYPTQESIGHTYGTTCFNVCYNGIEIALSRVIPIDIFNQTAYSIVAETNTDSTLSFYTEKTAKPIIARRLFVAFTGYRFLENLRSSGFKTFDGIIDETYDQIVDEDARYHAAMEQVKFLCNTDQVQVYDKAKDILEHNYNLLTSTDWDKQARNQIQQKINLL
jgi:hypothetical protein